MSQPAPASVLPPRLFRGRLSVEAQTALLAPVLALLVAVLAANLLVLAYGESPAAILGLLLAGTWGSAYGIGQVLFKATPLILTGIAVALPFRAGLFNIGAEGQAVVGALATGVVGASLPAGTPWPVAIPLAAGAGFGAGALWGGLPGWLRGRFGAHEVILTIMLNFVALALANYVTVSGFALPETLHGPPIVGGAELSRLSRFFPALHGSAASTAFFGALGVALLSWWLLFRTVFGYEVRVLGGSLAAAVGSGIPPARIMTLVMAIAGGCAGLVGTSSVQGYKHYYEDGFSGGIGFMGIAVALLGRNHPLGLILAALLFGTLSQGGLAINARVPKELVEILQAVIILAVIASSQEVARVLRRTGGGR